MNIRKHARTPEALQILTPVSTRTPARPPLTRVSGGPRTALLAGALAAALLAGLVAAPGVVRAQLAGTFPTTTAVPSGGLLTTTVTTPGANISSSTAVTGCPTTGMGTATVTYACTAPNSGILAGTSITQTFSAPGGQVSETVTYNANGPVAPFPAVATRTIDSGSCTTPTNIAEHVLPIVSPIAGITCSTKTSVTTIPGAELQVWVTGGGSLDLQISSAPSTLGTCPLTSSVPTTKTTFAVITYTCSFGQSVPAATGVSVGVQTSIPVAQLKLEAWDNANAPRPATTAIPSPTTQTITLGTAAGPALATINPSSGPAGTMVAITGSNLSPATVINFGTTPATNVVCDSSGATCSATAPTLHTGTTASVTAVTTAGTSNALSFTFTAPTTGTTTTGTTTTGTTTTGITTTGTTGTTTTGTTTTGTTTMGTAPATGTTGTTATGTTTAGTTATGVGMAGGFSVTNVSGWTIVGGPAGTVVTSNTGPLYTYQAGDADYETIASGTQLFAGSGYWAYFDAATVGTIPASNPQTLSIGLPAGQWVMIGNAGNTIATVSGADVVYTYSASSGYQATTSLVPGQGAWAISVNGGTATVANS